MHDYLEGSLLSFDKLIKAQEQLAILLHEVDKTLANKNRPLINWRISQVHSGSIHLTLEGMPQDQITPSQISEVIKTVERGIVTILEHPIRPKYFSDRALESARSLAILKKRDECMGDYPGFSVIKSSLSQPQKTPQLMTEHHQGDTDT